MQQEQQPKQQNGTESEQEKDLLSRFKAAILISNMDKQSRQHERIDNSQAAQKQDFQEIEVEHDGKKAKAYVRKDLKHKELEQDIDTHLKSNSTNVHAEGAKIISDILGQVKKVETKLSKKEELIFKKSPHLLQGWQLRFVVCEDRKLAYYVPENRAKPFGVLNFDIVTYVFSEVRNQQNQTTEFSLTPWNGQKVFQFKANTPNGTMEWAKIVQENLQASLGAQRVLKGLIHYHRYWRVLFLLIDNYGKIDRISAEQFAKDANNADIVLFRGNSANCVIQRTFTRSEYDHAALLLRFSSGNLFLFEATGFYGVGLCSWDSMIQNKWYDLYDKIVYRKLEIERSSEFLDAVQKFVNQNIGKKYSCSPQKLLKQKSSVQDLNKSQQKTDERTYFCSELVAALYKNLGLLPQEKAASQYWPGSFSTEKEDLKLLKGKLLPEQLIDFSTL